MDETTPDQQQREGRVVGRIPGDTFGHRLLLARAELRLTIEQAAAKCELLSQSWGQWERGSMPRDQIGVAEAVAEGLDIDRDWLLYGGPLRPVGKIRRHRVTYGPRPARPGGRRPRRLDRTRERTSA